MHVDFASDADTNALFDAAIQFLCEYFAYSFEDATSLARDFYASFRDAAYCRSIGVPVQDDNFFHHEGRVGVAMRIHYYLRLKRDPDPHKYVEWRSSYQSHHWERLQQLGRMMSDISEDCYCAGWLGNTEYIVPELCTRAVQSGTPQPWGQSEVTPAKAAELCTVAALLGYWANLHEEAVRFEPFQPFPVPAEILDEIERERRAAKKTKP